MCSVKNSHVFLFLLLLVMIAVNVELDVFLPALPQMQAYFQIKEGHIEWVLSINFLGLCISSIIFGYLSDIYGRKKIILTGTGLFLLGSLGCILTPSFYPFLGFRFLQGLGCGAPATVSYAAICDIHNESKSTQLISLFNGVITGAMIAAPFLGIFLTTYLGWRSNFIFIGILALLSFFLLLIFFPETTDTKGKKQFRWNSFYKNLFLILKAEKFWVYSMVGIMMYAALITFLANFSLLTINHLKISLAYYSWLQSALMTAFVTASFLCSWLMKRFPTIRVIKWGRDCVVCGNIILIGSIYFSNSPLIFTIAIACFNIGAAFLIAIFSTRVIHLFVSLKGLTSSCMGSIRMFVSAFFISLSSILFDGTFHSLGWLIFSMSLIACCLLFYDNKVSA